MLTIIKRETLSLSRSALCDGDRPHGGGRYGEISTEGCLMLSDALQLDPSAVVYDLGSGFGRATVLFAMCVVLSGWSLDCFLDLHRVTNDAAAVNRLRTRMMIPPKVWCRSFHWGGAGCITLRCSIASARLRTRARLDCCGRKRSDILSQRRCVRTAGICRCNPQ